MCMRVLLVCMPVYHVYVWGQWWPEADVGFPGTGVMAGCELFCRCWELNQGPLQEQKELLATEPSFHPWAVSSFFRVLKEVF